VLNCGSSAGSCHGGNHGAVYEFIKKRGYVPYSTCLQYAACSSESQEGICPAGNYECKDINICRTCSTFSDMGGTCSAIDYFPNASVAEYGDVIGAENIMKEIYARGPVACGINANEILDYQGGVIDMPLKSRMIDHIISIVGWGYNSTTGEKHWIIRNSWGEYWGELGYLRVKMGGDQLGIETSCVWATPLHYTELNFPCDEDGSNCVKHTKYRDPSLHFQTHPHLTLSDPALRAAILS